MNKRLKFNKGYVVSAYVSRSFTGIKVGKNGCEDPISDKKKKTTRAIIINTVACILPLILLLLLVTSESLSDTTDKPFIAVKPSPSGHLIKQPTYYPWHDVANGSLNFSQLW
jgi:hypothetical protein